MSVIIGREGGTTGSTDEAPTTKPALPATLTAQRRRRDGIGTRKLKPERQSVLADLTKVELLFPMILAILEIRAGTLEAHLMKIGTGRSPGSQEDQNMIRIPGIIEWRERINDEWHSRNEGDAADDHLTKQAR
jgi:hypothetical protein